MSAERSAVVAVPEDATSQQEIAAGAGCPQELIMLTPSRSEAAAARQIRARALVSGAQPADIASAIAAQCGCSRIRAYRLALGNALADVVAQVRARYEADGRRVPRFSETLLSAYEGGQKRPGPEYLHYLCATYQADPADLGFDGRCLCGTSHRPGPAGMGGLAANAVPAPRAVPAAAGSAATKSAAAGSSGVLGPSLSAAPGAAGPSPAGPARLAAAGERAFSSAAAAAGVPLSAASPLPGGAVPGGAVPGWGGARWAARWSGAWWSGVRRCGARSLRIC